MQKMTSPKCSDNVTIHMWLITQPPLKDICKRKINWNEKQNIFCNNYFHSWMLCYLQGPDRWRSKFGWIQTGQDVNKVEVLWCFGVGLLVGKLLVHGKFQIVLRWYFCWRQMWKHDQEATKSLQKCDFYTWQINSHIVS